MKILFHIHLEDISKLNDFLNEPFLEDVSFEPIRISNSCFPGSFEVMINHSDLIKLFDNNALETLIEL